MSSGRRAPMLFPMNGPTLADEVILVLASATPMVLAGLGKRRLEWLSPGRSRPLQRARLLRAAAQRAAKGGRR